MIQILGIEDLSIIQRIEKMYSFEYYSVQPICHVPELDVRLLSLARCREILFYFETCCFGIKQLEIRTERRFLQKKNFIFFEIFFERDSGNREKYKALLRIGT